MDYHEKQSIDLSQFQINGDVTVEKQENVFSLNCCSDDPYKMVQRRLIVISTK